MTFKIYYEGKRGRPLPPEFDIDIELIRSDPENFKKLKYDIENGTPRVKSLLKYFPKLQYINSQMTQYVLQQRSRIICKKLDLKWSGYKDGKKGNKSNIKRAVGDFLEDGNLRINYDAFIQLEYLDEFVELYTNWPKNNRDFIRKYFSDAYPKAESGIDALTIFLKEYYKRTGVKLQSKHEVDSPVRIFETIVKNYLDEFLAEMKEELYRENYDSMKHWFYLSPKILNYNGGLLSRFKRFCETLKLDIDFPLPGRGNRAFKNPGKKPRTNELGTPGNFPKQFRQITPPNSSFTPPSNYTHGGNSPKDNNFPST